MTKRIKVLEILAIVSIIALGLAGFLLTKDHYWSEVFNLWQF